MSCVIRKPVFGVSDQVGHKQGSAATENGKRLEILDLGSRGIVLPLVAKTKALISCAVVTVHLICAFVFAYAKSRFSHDAAHIEGDLGLSFKYMYSL